MNEHQAIYIYIDHIASYTWGVPHFAGNFGVVQVKHDGQSSNITSNGCDYSCLMVWDYQKSLVIINHRSRMATFKKMGMIGWFPWLTSRWGSYSSPKSIDTFYHRASLYLWPQTTDSKKSSSSVSCWNSLASDLQLWPFISYNWLFLWDYTFYKWGYKHF